MTRKAAATNQPIPYTMQTTSTIPQRQIRASYNKDTIIVYQAYNTSIASAAVATQRLNASPEFRVGRATWIKPSWTWMLYRSGYSYKDANQSDILAIRVARSYFIEMLRTATLASNEHPKGQGVVVQWDPERDVRLQRLPYRSIQIGIMGATVEEWIEKGIVGIEDVTEKARELKRLLDGETEVSESHLLERGLVMQEMVCDVPDDVRVRLEMD